MPRADSTDTTIAPEAPPERDLAGIIADMEEHLGTLENRVRAVATILSDRHGLDADECEGAAQVGFDALDAWDEVHDLWKRAFDLSRPSREIAS